MFTLIFVGILSGTGVFTIIMVLLCDHRDVCGPRAFEELPLRNRCRRCFNRNQARGKFCTACGGLRGWENQSGEVSQ